MSARCHPFVKTPEDRSDGGLSVVPDLVAYYFLDALNEQVARPGEIDDSDCCKRLQSLGDATTGLGVRRGSPIPEGSQRRWAGHQLGAMDLYRLART